MCRSETGLSVNVGPERHAYAGIIVIISLWITSFRLLEYGRERMILIMRIRLVAIFSFPMAALKTFEQETCRHDRVGTSVLLGIHFM